MSAFASVKRWWHARFGCGMFWKHTTPFERHCTVCGRSQRAMYTGDDWLVADWVDNTASLQAYNRVEARLKARSTQLCRGCALLNSSVLDEMHCKHYYEPHCLVFDENLCPFYKPRPAQQSGAPLA